MKKPFYREEDFNEDTFFETQGVVSANECTGLIPSAPENDEEEKSYRELYSVHIKKDE